MSYGKFTLVLCRAEQCLNSYATIKQCSILLTIFISPQSALSVARTRLMRRLINTLLSKSARDNKYWRKPWYHIAINSDTTDLNYIDFSLSLCLIFVAKVHFTMLITKIIISRPWFGILSEAAIHNIYNLFAASVLFAFTWLFFVWSWI